MRRSTATTNSRRGLFRRRRAATVEGVVRIDARTKNLLHRLVPGDIAVILHDDLDQLAAEGLVERGAAAVVNLHRSTTGRYPNAGPLVLARARVPLIDAVGEDLLQRIAEGDLIRITDGAIWRGEERVGEGVPLDEAAVQRQLADATEAIGEELERFVRNTMDYLQAERDLILRGEGIPTLRTKLEGRPVVVVVRGGEYREDLRTLRPYVADMRPAIIAVDGAADALIDEGMRPDIIIGDMDSVSTGALTCGAELVVHATPDGRAPGMGRIEGLGIAAGVFRSAGTSEDIALLLAHEAGADLIVAVGAHDNLIEFLDRGRSGMASTFLVRLKVGPKLIDARRVNRLYRTQVRTRDVFVLVGAALLAMIVAAASSPGLRLWFRGTLDWVESVFRSLF